ncbi:hypothetical protein MJG53_020221, partial [Ovis ammon polii x Ovis aries]
RGAEHPLEAWKSEPALASLGGGAALDFGGLAEERREAWSWRLLKTLYSSYFVVSEDKKRLQQGGGGASSEKLGFELCLATLGGGAAFHEAAADKKLQVEIFLDLIKCVA